MKNIFLLLLFPLYFSSCAQEEKYALKNIVDFEAICTTPLYKKYGNVKAIKVIYHLGNDKIYFINGNRFDFHYEFVQHRFDPFLDLLSFNTANYSNSETRAYLLGNINYYVAQNKFVLEIGPSDQMSTKQLLTLYTAVKGNTYFGEELLFFANTNNARKIATENPVIKTITPEEIYANQQYQPIHKKETIGRLKFIHDLEAEGANIKATDILVLNESPLYLPVCAGVLVSKFQTPLSHISLLGKNRNIPVCAHKDLFSFAAISKLDSKKVSFTVKQDTFFLKETTSDYTQPKIKKNKLKFDLSVDSLIDLTQYNKKHQNAIGSKASNFSKLVDYSKNLNFTTPESAFALPFYYYDEHIKASRANEWIQLLSNTVNLDQKEQQEILKTIRTKILEYPLSPQLILAIENKIKALGDFKRMRFRSSTNAEDLKGFSGAGLYLSKTGEINNPNKPIASAIKEVWASTWSQKAFFERELFELQQADVKMAVLIHRSFPDEEVNGVAITTNLYRQNYTGFVINLQKGDVNVVNQIDSIQPEQLILYAGSTLSETDTNYDIISHSSLSPNKNLLTKKELNQLAEVTEKIKLNYYRTHFISSNYYNFALDLEFKFDTNNRKLYIKQMREY